MDNCLWVSGQRSPVAYEEDDPQILNTSNGKHKAISLEDILRRPKKRYPYTITDRKLKTLLTEKQVRRGNLSRDPGKHIFIDTVSSYVIETLIDWHRIRSPAQRAEDFGFQYIREDKLELAYKVLGNALGDFLEELDVNVLCEHRNNPLRFTKVATGIRVSVYADYRIIEYESRKALAGEEEEFEESELLKNP